MKWSLQQLHKYNGRPFNFKTTYDFKEDIQNIDDFLDISICTVEGVGKNIFEDKFLFELNISVTMFIEDARTLDPVEFPINIQVEELFDANPTGGEDVRIIDTNTVNLREVVWENILLEKPIRVVKENPAD